MLLSGIETFPKVGSGTIGIPFVAYGTTAEEEGSTTVVVLMLFVGDEASNARRRSITVVGVISFSIFVETLRLFGLLLDWRFSRLLDGLTSQEGDGPSQQTWLPVHL